MNMRLILSFALAALALTGCSSDGVTYTKSEARSLGGRSPDGEDLCDRGDWYGDGECDSFCPERDSDCVECPGAEDGANYVSTDPERCADIEFACEPGTTAFNDDCGCGCIGTPVDPECEAQDARGDGDCRALIGVFFNGESCETVGGCDCVGEDCGEAYESIAACEAAHAECIDPSCEPVTCEIFCEHGFETDASGCEICRCAEPPVCEPVTCEIACEHGFRRDADGCEICECVDPACAPQEVRWVGGCEPGGAFHWDGSSCVYGTGCSCEGADCDNQYFSERECIEAHASCGGTDPVCPELPAAIIGSWQEDHDRSEGERRVFVDGDLDLGPTWYRQRYTFNADGTASVSVLAPDDGHYDVEATWILIPENIIQLRIEADTVEFWRFDYTGEELILVRTEDAPTYYGSSPEECSRIRFACEPGTEYFANECGCGCQPIEAPLCEPAPGDEGVIFYGDSREECAVIRFACEEGTEYFANDCGCGCQPSDEPTMCEAQEIRWVGDCEPGGGFHWNGERCEYGTGCSCEGADCDELFRSEGECLAAYAECTDLTCDPAPGDEGVIFYGDSREDCARIDYRCEPGTRSFINDCGCGCEPVEGQAIGEVCGGFAGLTCQDGAFCDFELAAMCGRADAQGVCQAIPEACTEEVEEVCGCDDRDYSNSCVAAAAGVSVLNWGTCDNPIEDGDACIEYDGSGPPVELPHGTTHGPFMCIDEGPGTLNTYWRLIVECEPDQCEMSVRRRPSCGDAVVACANEGDRSSTGLENVICEGGEWHYERSGSALCGG